ncbi:YihY/virulence factor BrkB family protein [Foetidibacter luteolus]|uniref:YihY/virulence factor BrkB family protein n=1 Tax=Foetidibacter luteolus TaxID=2608880 RepID=UPI001A9A1F33|nr:YihY/virulence factor BrkB family protein [Foetidibacter luteolus]
MTKLERIIITTKPVSFVINKSKGITLPGLQGLPLHDVFNFFIKQVKKVGLSERAAAISFNFIMAIPAATIFLCTLIPYMPISDRFFRELYRLVRDITPNRETQVLIINFLEDFFKKPKTGLLSLGFVLALFYSSNAMMGVIRTFDKSLHEKHKTNFVAKRLRAIRLTLIVIFLLIGTVLISVGQGVLFKTIMGWLHIQRSNLRWLIKLLNWLVILALFLYSIGFIYKYAPSVKKRWKLVSPGAVFATALIILTTWGFSFWVQNFSNFNKFYGSIGTLLILMLLVFINSLMILIGYELNISITYLKQQADMKKPG